jgi:hypothetical protein
LPSARLDCGPGTMLRKCYEAPTSLSARRFIACRVRLHRPANLSTTANEHGI